jgi:hypothetical protein
VSVSVARALRRAWIEELATEVGRLRRSSDLDVHEYRVDRVASLVEWLWVDVTPTAAELMREGLTVDEALAEAEREKRRQHRILAEEMVEKRRLARIRQREVHRAA